jgi:DNA-binding cell septation regulator SpoVG
MSNIKLDVRVYPLDNPQGKTKAFASVGFEDLVAINGIRVVNSEEKGLYVSMPQSRREKDGEIKYHDIAFPINGELRKEVNKAVLDQYREAIKYRHQSLGDQSLGDQLREGQEQVRQYKRERAAQPPQPQAAYAKSTPGLGD